MFYGRDPNARSFLRDKLAKRNLHSRAFLTEAAATLHSYNNYYRSSHARGQGREFSQNKSIYSQRYVPRPVRSNNNVLPIRIATILSLVSHDQRLRRASHPALRT